MTKSADSFLEKLKTKVNERVHYQKNFTVFEESVASEVQGNYLDRFKSPQIKALNLEIPNQSAIRPGKKHHKKFMKTSKKDRKNVRAPCYIFSNFRKKLVRLLTF